jgi:hypothetical protein
MASTTAELTIRYPHSPIVVAKAPRGAKVTAGEHFPFLNDEDVHKHVANCWGIAHTVVTVAAGHRAPAAGQAGRQVLIADADAPVAGYDVVIADPQRVVARRLGLLNGGRIVVRPDTYIGAVAPLGDATTVADYFETIAG